MFDFQHLSVYQKAKVFRQSILPILRGEATEEAIRSQLARASLSIVLNIAEGTRRRTESEKRHFFVIARGSVFECAAILDLLSENKEWESYDCKKSESVLEEISKMLFRMIQINTKMN